ncbi:2,3-bisphosphoglycerate-dependent phosphoglycerate mutase [Symbiodinium microadriaticum]|uniref:2,3-bisphosphoglycerate-dependent phosphoglycerate mutase n=1 Tax=Symbiodinium microadriaticum TaxID=2951 RepID=A0A1Q9DZ82_SYMMI|nr:2,3-bisphosphoglycerate-dependent phosphoglycerate mutase [Symbiodinium microadriaticum]
MAPKVMKKASPGRLLKQPLRHRFFALRHGESKANVAKIIISDPKVGTKKYGLTKAGRAAVKRTGARFIKSASSRVVIVSSDFARARETAQVFAKTLRKAGLRCPVQLSTALRERRFGSLEGGSDSRYNEVWSKDRRNAAARPFGAESAKELEDVVFVVAGRGTQASSTQIFVPILISATFINVIINGPSMNVY